MSVRPQPDEDLFFLRLIALLKYGEGALLLAVTCGVAALIGRDVDSAIATLLWNIHINTDTAFMQKLLDQLALVQKKDMIIITLISAAYAALVLVEGVGLWTRQRWAEILTVVATGFFIPYEIFEVVRRVGWTRLLILILNVAIVVYLAMVLRNKDRSAEPTPEPATPASEL